MELSDKVSFPTPEDMGSREWGHETLLLHAKQKYIMKLITMRKGKKGGYQYHRLKDEGGIVTAGEMLVRYKIGDEKLERKVTVGDVFHFPPGARHQIEALTNCSYIEVSNPVFNDRVHAEHEFGIEKEEGGLPSTTLDEIEVR
jgi:quercetin dioxygenase-like cupin family protein